MRNAINWFEIPVNDLERAMGFYGEVFGLKFEQVEMGPMTLAMIQGKADMPGANGALVKGEQYTPSMSGTVVYFGCEDVNVQAARIERMGGKVIAPKTSIGEWGFIAHFVDTEGNHVAMHSMK